MASQTCDERLEAMLGRAGQTISDLPKREGTEASEPYPMSALPKANGAAWNWYLNNGEDMEDYDSTRSKMVLKLYILHLTDIIDRMEWALKNLLNIYDRQTHIIANVDAPEGLTQEQYYKAVEAIIEALDKYRAGLEPWDDWGFEDAEEV